MKHRRMIILALGFSLFGHFVVSSASFVPAGVESAALNEEWLRVVKLCANDKELVRSPALRALKGHACLALNQNDESLGLFLSIVNAIDRNDWLLWTRMLLKRNPNNRVAQYLNGDALARQGRWKEAIKLYSKALKTGNKNTRSDFVLAFNARGIAYAKLKDFNSARDDLDAAIACAPEFADAHANLGTLKFLKGAPDTAIADYTRAIERSKSKSRSFSLALNGRACARIKYALDEDTLTASLADLYSASTDPSCHLLIRYNLECLAPEDDYESELSEDPNESPGTTLSATQFLALDDRSRREYASNLSPMGRIELGQDLIGDIDYNRAHIRVMDQTRLSDTNIGGVHIPFTNTDVSRDNLKEQQGALSIIQETQANKGEGVLGRTVPTGGAKTAGLEGGTKSGAEIPLKTWFGLAQCTEGLGKQTTQPEQTKGVDRK